MKFKIRDGSPQETPTEFWLELYDDRVELKACNLSVERGKAFNILAVLPDGHICFYTSVPAELGLCVNGWGEVVCK